VRGVKVSTRGDYGVRALVELALHYGEGPVQSSEIAARQGIPEAYLDQLLVILRRAGLVRSLRGPQGGHMLAREPKELRLSEALLALEGSLSPIDCLEEEGACNRSGGCPQRSVWEEVREATLKVLERTTIADLAARERRPDVGRYYI